MKFNFLSQTKKPKVEIITQIPGLAQILECQPQPAYKFFPEWFKKVSRFSDEDIFNKNDKGTIKNCPVFAEYLTQGFVIPLWCDTYIKSDNSTWEVVTSSNEFSWDMHPDMQYLDFIPEQDKEYLTLKAISPWFVKTPPGYSLYQKNLYYHFHKDFTILPGSINTDYHHIVNQQVLVEKNKEIFLPRGTPFVWYIPYQRTEYTYETRLSNDKDNLDIQKSFFDVRSKFIGAYKERKKKL